VNRPCVLDSVNVFVKSVAELEPDSKKRCANSLYSLNSVLIRRIPFRAFATVPFFVCWSAHREELLA